MSPQNPLTGPDEHSAHVAHLAVEAFQALYPLHRLGPRDMAVLQAAGQLHDIGLAQGRDLHHDSSRRMIMERHIEGMSDLERLMAAIVAGYHRKQVVWERDGDFNRLPKEKQQAVLLLAGMLRIADGLDYTHEQAAAIVGMQQRRKRARLLVSRHGSAADIDIGRANNKADLWNAVARKPIQVELLDKSKVHKGSPVVSARCPAPEAARKIMRFHFERVLAHEAGTRLGENIEDLHHMRVATRRLRAAFKLFRKVVGRQMLAPFVEDLRWLGSTLGAVRDLDVGIAYVQSVQEQAGDEEQRPLAAILDERRRERAAARGQMLECLDSDRYHAFIERFGEFLNSPWLFVHCAGYDEPLAQFAPRVVLRQLKCVRRYRRVIDNATPEELHALRIDCKRFRYAAEFVRNAYPRRLQQRIDQIIAVQDALGEIHDADVRIAALEATVERSGSRPELADGIQRIVDVEQQRRAEQLAQFHKLWPAISRKKFRRRLERIFTKPR